MLDQYVGPQHRFHHRLTCNSETYLKLLVGNTDVDDALQRLNDLTEEEARIASAELCKATHCLGEEALRKWLSPPDPSTNHNKLWKIHVTGTTSWFTCGTIFKD